MMCQTLGVSPSGYYAWSARAPSARSVADAALTQRIQRIHEESRETWGAGMQAELSEQGVRVSGKRVARLMKAAGVAGSEPTQVDPYDGALSGASPAPDLVDRDFTAPGPDRLWVADITYIATWAGFLYLAVNLNRAWRFVKWR